MLKVFVRISFLTLPILLIFLGHQNPTQAQGTINPRGGSSSEAPAPVSEPVPDGMVLGTVEVSGEITEGQPQVFLRGQKESTQVLVILPTDAFAAGKVLDRDILPYAVGKNLTLTLREFESDRGLQGVNVGIAQGGNDRRTGNVLDLPSRTASVTILMLESTGNRVTARLNYLFEENINHRFVDYSELNFLAYPDDLESKWKGSVTGSGSLAQVEAEETVDLSFSGEGLGKGKAIVKVSPVVFATGKPLDLAKLQSGSTLAACAYNVPASVTYGDKTVNRTGNFQVNLKKGDGVDSLTATLAYDFSSIYPAQDIRLDLKSDDLSHCYVEAKIAVNMNIPAIYTEEPRTPGDPLGPEDSGTDTPSESGGDTPGTVEETSEGRVTGNDFRPEHFVDEASDNKITATGNAVTGGSKGIACALHLGSPGVTDLWMILGVMGGLLPLLRRIKI